MPLTDFRFRLYVMGRTSRARNAEQQLRALCDAQLGDRYEIEVVDVTEQPDRADEDRIVATPTLDRLEPPPRVRVIGDLASRDRLSAVLELPSGDAAQREGRT